MNKALLYSLFSVVVGLALVLAPPLVLSRLTSSDHDVTRSFFQGLRDLEGAESRESLGQSRISLVEVEALAVTFAIALGTYVVLKRKAPRRHYGTVGPYLY